MNMNTALETDLEQRIAEVEAREQAVERREKGIRHHLYSRINVSVRTMDIFIFACAAAIASLVVLGICLGSIGSK